MNELFDSTDLKSLVEESKDILARAKERFRPVATICLFSGGNDSTALFELVSGSVDAALHIKTGIGIIDKGRTATDHVEAMCKAKKVPLIVLDTKPEVYRHIVLRPDKPKGGFPGRHDICYHLLKNQRLQEFQRDNSKRGQTLLFVSGVRKSESKRRSRGVASKEIDAPRGRLKRCAWVNPIIGFTQAHLLSLRNEKGLPQCEGAQFIHKSGECLCGSFPSPVTLDEIEFWFPATGAYIRSLEREAQKMGKPYCKWGQGPTKNSHADVGPLCSECSLFTAMESAVKVPKEL